MSDLWAHKTDLLIDARHAKAALDMAANKTDPNDADALAYLAKVRFHKEVRAKSFDSMLCAYVGSSAYSAGADRYRAPAWRGQWRQEHRRDHRPRTTRCWPHPPQPFFQVS
ncbi:transposase [Sphingomonas xinjiangensis]|uniref:Transposase n=1 Tax=Sphingomonas xinjiangensis TaxID=643568 RepID=A0A840YSL1_9SPHN|nr:transposase [Sphingomonas xinjiangensis]